MSSPDRFHFAPIGHRPNRFYLAYGSNLSEERMKSRCPDAQVIGTTQIPGYRLLFKQSASGFYATIEQDANSMVPVVVYKISEADEARLDRFEGCPKHYYKRLFRLPVIRTNGRRMSEKKQCMAYILHEDRLLGCPRTDYYKILDEGYQRWGFDIDILDKGLSDSIGKKAADKYIAEYADLL